MKDLQSTHKDFLFEIEEVGIKTLYILYLLIVSKLLEISVSQQALIKMKKVSI